MIVSTISLDDFLTRLNENNLHSKNDGFQLKESLVIDSNVVNWSYREIRNLEFSELVQISQVEIASGLAFVDCNFHKGIVIKDLDSRKFDIALNPFNTSLVFSNCSALDITFTDFCKIDRGILIEKDCKIGTIKFHQTVIKNHGFHIKDSHIGRTLDISQVKSEIRISKSTIGGDLHVENLEGNVSLIKSVFKGWVKFWACTCKNSFVLNYNTFEDTFNIEGCKLSLFSTIGDKFGKDVTIENRDTSENSLETHLKSFYMSEAEITETFILDGLGKPIHHIKLPITPKFKGVLRIVNWKAQEFRLSGVNENLKLLASQCSIQRLITIDFTNSANVSFDRCIGEKNIYPEDKEGDSTFISAHSDFGPTRFNEFNFDSFQVIRVDNVLFNEIIATNVNWFRDQNLIIGDGESINQNNFRRRREIYRQLKHALNKSGNNIDALEFQAREMRTLRNEKKASNNYGFSDRLIMITNMTNNYGMNWLKPLSILILGTIFYYCLIIPILSNKLSYGLCFNTESWSLTLEEFFKGKEVLFQLFNPARRFDLVYGENRSDWLYLWDAFHRLFLGILIFQIIRAFRKYYVK